MFTMLLHYLILIFFKRSLEHHYNRNLKPGSLTPFNMFSEYQRFVSYLVFSDSSPPTTTLNEDATRVSYKDKTMVLEDWISGMRKVFDEVSSGVKALCGGEDLDPVIPDNVADDMNSMVAGYSWINAVETLNPHMLLRHLTRSPEM